MAVSGRSDCEPVELAKSCLNHAAVVRAATSSFFALDEVSALVAMDLADSIHAADTPFFANPNLIYRNRADAPLLLYGQNLSIETMECHFQYHRCPNYD